MISKVVGLFLIYLSVLFRYIISMIMHELKIFFHLLSYEGSLTWNLDLLSISFVLDHLNTLFFKLEVVGNLHCFISWNRLGGE